MPNVVFDANTVSLTGGTYNVVGSTTTGGGGFVTFGSAVNLVNLGATLSVGSSATFNSGESMTVTTLNVTGGTFGGTDNFVVTGSMNWSGGTISGSGSLNVLPAATLSISGVTAKLLSGERSIISARPASPGPGDPEQRSGFQQPTGGDL